MADAQNWVPRSKTAFFSPPSASPRPPTAPTPGQKTPRNSTPAPSPSAAWVADSTGLCGKHSKVEPCNHLQGEIHPVEFWGSAWAIMEQPFAPCIYPGQLPRQRLLLPGLAGLGRGAVLLLLDPLPQRGEGPLRYWITVPVRVPDTVRMWWNFPFVVSLYVSELTLNLIFWANGKEKRIST